jgi:frataxin-like iron-binding protein CyaY
LNECTQKFHHPCNDQIQQNQNSTQIEKKNHIYTNYNKSVIKKEISNKKKIIRKNYATRMCCLPSPNVLRYYHKEMNKMYTDIQKKIEKMGEKILTIDFEVYGFRVAFFFFYACIFGGTNKEKS